MRKKGVPYVVVRSGMSLYEGAQIRVREDSELLYFEVETQRKKWRLKRTLEKQVEEESEKAGLRREDVLCRSKWSAGVNQIAAG